MSIDSFFIPDMKKLIITLFIGLTFAPCIRANGDPVIAYSANIRSCNPVPLKVSEVQVVREDLNIRVRIPYTEVSVVYRLKNSSATPIHVDYGFPVDYGEDKDSAPGTFTTDEWSASLAEAGVRGRAVRDVHFRLDGRELTWTHADEIVKLDESYVDEETGETVELKCNRLWTYTVLDIPAGATVTLEVDYAVLCNWSTGLGSLNASPLSRYFPSDGNFYYDFTPAQHWGNGKAGELAVKVDCSGLPDAFFNEDSPSVAEGWMKRKGKVWTVNEKNLDFATAGPLSVYFYKDYSDEDRLFPSWGDPLKDCAVPSAEYRLSVSASQDSYPASNLQDGDLATAWVAPGDGVGSTVEIVFPQPRRVSDIALWNGYHKSASLWSANSRIKRIRMEITRADGHQDSWETDLTQWEWDSHYFTLYDSRIPRFGAVSLLSVTNLDRDIYGRELGADEEGNIQYDKVSADAEKVTGIRLTVLETTPGTRYKDLCLSELVVLDGFTIVE